MPEWSFTVWHTLWYEWCHTSSCLSVLWYWWLAVRKLVGWWVIFILSLLPVLYISCLSFFPLHLTPLTSPLSFFSLSFSLYLQTAERSQSWAVFLCPAMSFHQWDLRITSTASMPLRYASFCYTEFLSDFDWCLSFFCLIVALFLGSWLKTKLGMIPSECFSYTDVLLAN